MEAVTQKLDNRLITHSFLRWAGSKKQLIPQLSQYWHSRKFNSYIEPFVGAGNLFFSISPNSSILGDINSELILTYCVLRDEPSTLYSILKEMPIEKKYYYWLRSINLSTLTKEERGARFIYLNRFCFNGLYRTNIKGVFNVPFSDHKKNGKLLSLDNLLYFSNKLKNVALCNSDFKEILHNQVKEGDFIYLDPPYISDKRIFNEYSYPKFDKENLEYLIECLDTINNKKAYFLLSYIKNSLIEHKINQWKVRTVITNRNISSKLSSREPVQEILVTNITL